MNRKERRANKKNKNGAQLNGSPAFDKQAYLKNFGRARSLLNEGNLAESTQILNDLLKLNPRDHGVLECLGIASELLKNYEAALKFFKAAQELNPDRSLLSVCIGRLLIKTDNFEEGIAILEKTLDQASDLSDTEKAVGHSNLGAAYTFKGKIDQAANHYQQACELAPQCVEHLYNLVTQVRKIKDEDDKYFQMLLKLEEEKPFAENTQNCVMLYYALFEAYDSLKNYDTAFEKAKKGASYQRKNIKYNPETFKKAFDTTKEFFDEDFFEKNAPKEQNAEQPVFIIGMPRSGTTLLEQILGAHPDIGTMGEDELLGYLIKNFSYIESPAQKPYPLRFNAPHNQYMPAEDIAERYVNYLKRNYPDKKRVTNKAISNFFWFPFIKLTMPDARFIHIERNPVDCCLSTYTKFFQDEQQPYSYDLTELGHYYAWYKDLMNHWNTLFPDDILNLKYENLVDDPKANLELICKHLDIPFSEECLNYEKGTGTVRTASVSQVRKPIYKSSVGRWKRYGPKVIPLIEALGAAALPEAIDFLKENGITPDFAD